MSEPSPLLLGVDAGGTKSRALLATTGPAGRFCLLGVGEAGPGNPMSHGLAQATGSIVEAIRAAMAAAPAQVDQADFAVVAAAGAADELLRAALERQLTSAKVAARCRVVPDYQPFLALASPPVVGVIAGTGSVVIVQGVDGRVQRFGGWGYLLGDEGSGYAIGRIAIRAALAELEAGMASLSDLAQASLTALNVSDRAGLLAAVYQADDHRTRIASVARAVVALAARDMAAAELLRGEARSLAESLVVAIRSAGFASTAYTLAAGGGILAASPLFRQCLVTALDERGLSPGEVAVVRDPAIGCLALAQGENG